MGNKTTRVERKFDNAPPVKKSVHRLRKRTSTILNKADFSREDEIEELIDTIDSSSKIKIKKKDKNKIENEVFIVGLAGAGKSTFIKQAKIIYNEGFTSIEREANRNILKQNVFSGMKTLLLLVEKSYPLNETLMREIRYFNSIDQNNITIGENQHIWKRKVQSLWNDEPSIKPMWVSNVHTMQLQFLDYHIAKLDHYCDESYEIQNEDILRGRQRTSGTSDLEININKNTKWKITDVGGQKSEREKWNLIINRTHQDDNLRSAKVILFFISLDDFHIPSTEDNQKMNSSLSEEIFKNLLDMISEHGDFNIVLCFNKIDLLRERIIDEKYYNNFKAQYPDYKESQLPNSMEKRLDIIENSILLYLQERFKNLAFINTASYKNEMSIFVTCGLDTNLVQKTFKGISDTLFSRRLNF